MEYPQVDLPVDVIAWNDVTEDILNIYKQSCRLQACIFALCLKGSVTASINLMDIEIKKGDFVTLMPGTILQVNEQKEKLKLGFIGFSAHCISGVNILQSIGSSLTQLMYQPCIHLNETFCNYIEDYFNLWAKITTGNYPPDTIVAQNAFKGMLLCVERLYNLQPNNTVQSRSRKEELCRQLVQLVTENYATERQAQFYAEKLNITQQYLSTIVKQTTGKNVLDIIAHVVLVDAKAKLKASNMTIKEIAYSLNFPNASFFGKYFKHYTGITPLEYRNS